MFLLMVRAIVQCYGEQALKSSVTGIGVKETGFLNLQVCVLVLSVLWWF